ncbi:MAG: outer membrane protein assembly factor BamB [Gammaproteobacteria bacterium]|nr:outer membrane protein assembly factor BamB [Gammaproteobacteria bacterium]
MIKRLLILLMITLISACGSEEDNSEPPAELTVFAATAKVEKLWSVSIGDGVQQQFLKLYPLLLDDSLIVADRNGDVTAINLEDGKELWKVELNTRLSAGVGGNQQNILVSSSEGEVILLDAEGAIKWRVSVSSEILVPPVIADGKVIVRSVDGQITALELATGKDNWNFKRDVPKLSLRGNSSPVVDRGRIYNGLDNGRLVALSTKDGRSVFDITVAVPQGRSELERVVDIDGDAVLENGVLYVGSYQGRVVAVDVRRGELLWTRKLSTYTGVSVNNSSLFSSDGRDLIWALDSSNGATLWQQEKLKARQLTKPVIMDETIVVADFEGYLHWLSQYDGRFIARIQFDDTGILVPPIVRENRLYVINREGRLAAFQVEFK